MHYLIHFDVDDTMCGQPEKGSVASWPSGCRNAVWCTVGEEHIYHGKIIFCGTLVGTGKT